VTPRLSSRFPVPGQGVSVDRFMSRYMSACASTHDRHDGVLNPFVLSGSLLCRKGIMPLVAINAVFDQLFFVIDQRTGTEGSRTCATWDLPVMSLTNRHPGDGGVIGLVTLADVDDGVNDCAILMCSKQPCRRMQSGLSGALFMYSKKPYL
jgi:hypothetical protein